MKTIYKNLKTGRQLVFAAIIALTASTASFAQVDEIKKLAGYVDLGDLTSSYGEPKVEINLGPSMLGFASALIGEDDPEARALMNGLLSVRLRIYDIEGTADAAITQIQQTSKQLLADNWEQVIKVKEDQEDVRVFLKMVNSEIKGMTVLVAGDDDQAVFINIIGTIKPADLGKLTEALDLDIDLP